jgi:aerobic-type carbon monoxide dehydrogenase small subunit (CoxS/CutS family)
MAVQINVNGKKVTATAAADTPLLYVLSNELQLRGPRFGCGLAQCGSCSVLVDGVEKRSCVTPVSAVEGRSVTTLEGLPEWYTATRKLAQTPDMHPVQQALLDEQSPQCGYCYNGMIVKAAELLSKNPKPDDRQIRSAMNGHLCRCGTYPTIQRAIRRASDMMSAPEARR